MRVCRRVGWLYTVYPVENVCVYIFIGACAGF